MEIKTLDEAQGTTREMIAGYCERKGWTRRITATGTRQIPPNGSQSWSEEDPWFLVARIAEVEKRTEQEILREINPRLREFPGAAAQAAHHRGKWMCVDTSSGSPVIVIGRFNRLDNFLHSEHLARGSFVGYGIEARDAWRQRDVLRFWPIDDFGSKVRWPERNGAML
ncbi:MAG TPA: hypothetical protein PKV97_00035 [Thauera aminoaromatica]|nr:hypothetical protein [Thauera aminoaromatica]